MRPPDGTPGPTPATAAPMLSRWGFLAHPDFPDGPLPGYLLVALRDGPTFEHYDPELIEFWVSRDGRGARRRLDRTSRMPDAVDFSWGPIRIVDRLGITNEWLGFGGRLTAERVAGMTIAVFVSPAPLLRRGGHSQGWDPGADSLGAFFGRMMIAVDFAPGFEQRVAAAPPLARYSAFVADMVARSRRARALLPPDRALGRLMEHETAELRRDHPDDWTGGLDLLEASGLGVGEGRSAPA